MRLLTWAALIGGGYYLYNESQKEKKAAEAKPGVNVPGVIVPENEEGSPYVEGGGMYLNMDLPGDVIYEWEADPSMLEGYHKPCCAGCAQTGGRCGG